MEKYSKLQNKILGRKEQVVSELLRTHPYSSKRINEVIKKSKKNYVFKPIVAREIFLKKIDGMTFGNKINEGILKSDSFTHPELGIFFKFPKDFFFINLPTALVGNTDNETQVIFDIEKTKDKDIDFFSYFQNWSKFQNILDYETYSVNSFQLARAIIKRKKSTIRLLILRKDKINYRFIMTSLENENFNFYDQKLLEIANTFKMIPKSEILKINPNKINIVTANMGDTINSMSKNQTVQEKYSKELFLLLNNLKTEIKPGKKYKIITNF